MNPSLASHPDLETLRQFAAGQLPPDQEALVEQHLMDCDRCGPLVAAILDLPFARHLRKVCRVPEHPGSSEQPAEPKTIPDAGELDQGSPRPAVPPPLPGSPALPPRYERAEILGRGGMAVVYRAWDREMACPVAVKMLLAGALATSEEEGRFLREGQMLRQLDHPNILRVHDCFRSDGQLFLVMQYEAGGSLAELWKGQPQPASAVAQTIEVLARAIQLAHDRGIIHRDLKPGNILLAQDGTLRIADFGLAKRLNDSAAQTVTGMLLGTPRYMAPEQACGQVINSTVDVYALGVILYEGLIGKVPFQGASPQETLQLVLQQEPVPPRRLLPQCPRDLETICLKCLQKEPQKRYQSATELAEDLRRWQANEPINARPVGTVERLGKWCRRNRLAVSLAGAIILLLLAGTAVSSTLAILNGRNAKQAEIKADEATAARRLSERRLYAARIPVIQRLIDRGQVVPALELLDSLRPEQTDGIDLRGWEWYYLKRLCHQELFCLSGHTDEVLCVAVTRDGSLVASGSKDRTVRLWDSKRGQPLHVFTGHSGQVNSVAFSPDGKQLASASSDATVRIWDVASGKESLCYTNHVLDVNSVVFHPSGKELASGSSDATVRIWDRKGKDRLILQMHLNGISVTQVAYSRDGRQLAALATPGWLRIWDAATGKELVDPIRNRTPGLASFAWGPNGQDLAVVNKNWQLRFWNPNKDFGTQSTAGGGAPLDRAVFSPDGRWIASCTLEDPAITIRDTISGKTRNTLKGNREGVHHLALSEDGRLLASAGKDHLVRIWDPTLDREVAIGEGHRNSIITIAFSSDGRQLLSGSSDRSIRLWDAATGVALSRLGEHEKDGILKLGFFPDSNRVISFGYDSTIRFWSNGTPTPLIQLDEEKGIYGVALSPRSSRAGIVTQGNRTSVQIWDLQARKMIREFGAGEQRIVTLAFSPDGSQLATAGEDRQVWIWDVFSGQAIKTLSGHTQTVEAVAFNAAGTLLASGGQDGTVQIWDLATGEQRGFLRGQGGSVTGVSFSPDDQRLASAGGALFDRGVTIWDLTTGQELLHFPGHCPKVYFSPDGKRLAAPEKQVVKIWDCSPIDDQPFRQERFSPVRTTQQETDAQPTAGKASPAQLKPLGWFTMDRLPTPNYLRRGPIQIPPRLKDRQLTFLVVVCAVPRQFLPKEKEHPLTETESVNAGMFQLLLPGNRRADGNFVSWWPLLSKPWSGFQVADAVIHHTPQTPDQRRFLAIAWLVRQTEGSGPFKIKMRDQKDDEEVPVPDLRLQLLEGLDAENLDLSAHPALEWIRRNYHLGPDHREIVELLGRMAKNTGKNDNIEILVGPNLTKTSQPYLLLQYNGTLLVLEMTLEQTDHLRVPSGEFRTFRWDQDQVRLPLPATLSQLVLKPGEGLPEKPLFSGQVSLAAHEPFPEGLAMRVSCKRPGAFPTKEKFFPLAKDLGKKATLPFAAPKDPTVSGPLLVIVELCLVPEKGKSDVIILSNPVAGLINAGPAAKPGSAR